MRDGSDVSTSEKMKDLLRAHFGSMEQRERFKVELACHSRQPGESIQALSRDIQRLM